MSNQTEGIINIELVATRRSFIGGVAASTAIVPLTASAIGAQTTAVRVVALPSDVSAMPFYAKDNGFFAEARLDVEVQTMGNGAAILAAVASGAADVGASNVGTLAAAAMRGLPFTIVAPAGLYQSSHPVTLLAVSANSKIAKAADLNGKTVAVNGLRELQQAGVQAWLDQNGADTKSVGFVELPFAAMGAALDAGRVDAALITEPALTEAKSKIRILGKAYDAVAPQFQIVVWAANRDWVAKTPDVARRFADSMKRTATWANTNQAQSAHILVRYTKLSDSVADTMTRVRYATSLASNELQPVIDVMARYGFLPKSIDVKSLIAVL